MRTLLVLAIAAGVSACAHGGALAPGHLVAGDLAQTDQVFADGSHYRVYPFQGRAGDTITARLTSDDFDANLILTDAHGNHLAEDDDGDGACNARLTFVLPATGGYRLYANSSARAELGAFRIDLQRGSGGEPADSTCRGFGRVRGLLQVGETLHDSLSGDDPLLAGDSTYFQRWILPVTPGRPVTVDLSSTDFDPYLMLARGRERVVSDDDGGPGCDARLVFTPVDARPLRVVVNTSSRPVRQTGRFTLRVSDGRSPVDSSADCLGLATHTIRAGEERSGALGAADFLMTRDTTYAQVWALEGRAGETVTVDLVSTAFDAYLMVAGPGFPKLLQDDDDGGNCNARITITFTQSGSYQLLVNTAEPRGTGSFRLAVKAGAPASGSSVPPCNRE